MGLVSDIVATYRGPRAVIRRHLAIGQREDRAFMYVTLACVLIFVAQWPRLQRDAYFDDSIPFEARLGGALMAWIFLAPLILFGLAAVSHLVAKALGGAGTWYSARLALFWSLLAVTPLWLFNGIVAGFAGPGPIASFTGLVALAVFAVFWAMSLWEAEQGV